MQIEQAHLLYALLRQEEGLIGELMRKMNVQGLEEATLREIERLPKVTGSGREPGKVYIAADVEQALNEAERQAEGMRDEYVSVEHVFLGLMEKANDVVKRLLREKGVEKARFLSALQEVRGNTRVTSDSPESTYDALKKYGQELVELARRQKLDPVIGRDTEIRLSLIHI